MIVVDSSVAVEAVISSGGSGAVSREVMARDGDVHAPHLLHVQVLSAIRRRASSGRLPGPQAATAVAALRALNVISHGHAGLLQRAWELRHGVTAYDAVYVALAEALGCDLVTADAPLSRAHGLRCGVRLLQN